MWIMALIHCPQDATQTPDYRKKRRILGKNFVLWLHDFLSAKFIRIFKLKVLPV